MSLPSATPLHATTPQRVVDVPGITEAELQQAGQKTLSMDDKLIVSPIGQTTVLAMMPDWDGLINQLRATALFGKAASTSNTNAFTVLMAALNSNAAANDPGRLADFQYAIAQVRKGLLLNDFTTAEISQFNQILKDNRFSFTVN
jgi:hypothetical protein